MSKVLFVSPHPDDETLGCGGTIFYHKKKGDDIFIPSQNRCIEVKSKYTSQISTKIINAKLQALRLQNYKVDLWIFNEKGELIP